MICDFMMIVIDGGCGEKCDLAKESAVKYERIVNHGLELPIHWMEG